MFASWFCVGTVCECLLCGGWNHRSLLSLLIAQGWHPWISTTLQMPAAGQRGLIQRIERWQGATRPNPRCSNSLYAPAWPSCVCCLWWVSNQRIEKHGSLWMLRDTIFVFMTRYLKNSFLLPHNATCLEFIYFKVFKINYTKFTVRCFKIFIGFSFNLNNLLTYCGLF